MRRKRWKRGMRSLMRLSLIHIYYHTVKTMSREDAVAAGLYEVIGKEIDDKYMAELKKQIIHPDVIREMADDKMCIRDRCGRTQFLLSVSRL